MGGVIFTRFLNVYPFLNISGGVSATVNVNTTIVFIVAVTAVYACLLRGFILSPLSLNCLRALSCVLLVTALMRLIRVMLGGVSPTLCRTLNVFLPLVAAGYTVLNVTVVIVSGSCGLVRDVMFTMTASVNCTLTLMLFTNVHRRVRLASVPGNMGKVPTTLVMTNLLTVTFVNFSKMY